MQNLQMTSASRQPRVFNYVRSTYRIYLSVGNVSWICTDMGLNMHNPCGSHAFFMPRRSDRDGSLERNKKPRVRRIVCSCDVRDVTPKFHGFHPDSTKLRVGTLVSWALTTTKLRSKIWLGMPKRVYTITLARVGIVLRSRGDSLQTMRTSRRVQAAV